MDGSAEVLVVEDEAMLLMLLRDVLQWEGLRVATAPDAERAFAAMAEGGAAARAAVLVTDLNLGFGPDGLAVGAEARRRLPGVHVIYATGNPDALDGVPLRPGDAVRGKPFDVIALAAEVRALVEAARAAAPAA